MAFRFDEIGNRLRAYRMGSGLSADEIAKQLGISRTALYRFEKGEHAKIETLDSFSGHADHSELLAYYSRMTGRKEQTWLVHGEPERSEAFKIGLRDTFKANAHVATLGQTVEW